MIKISFLLPTRKRIEKIQKLFQSTVETTSKLDQLEIVLAIDEDDLESQEISHPKLNIKKVILPKGSTMGFLNQACYKASSGKYVMLMNDDITIKTNNWDEKVFSSFAEHNDDIALVYTNDLMREERLSTFPILSRKACEIMGYICPNDYRRYAIDDHIFDIFNILAFLGHRRMTYLSEVIFEHQNFEADPYGKIYVPLNEYTQADVLTFDRLLEERKKIALRIAVNINPNSDTKNLINLLHGVKDSYSYRKSSFIIHSPPKKSSLLELVYKKINLIATNPKNREIVTKVMGKTLYETLAKGWRYFLTLRRNRAIQKK